MGLNNNQPDLVVIEMHLCISRENINYLRESCF